MDNEGPKVEVSVTIEDTREKPLTDEQVRELKEIFKAAVLLTYPVEEKGLGFPQPVVDSNRGR